MTVRVTLDLEPAALDALRELAARTNRSLGQVASDLILREHRPTRNGVPLLRARPGVVVTNDLIDRIRESEKI